MVYLILALIIVSAIFLFMRRWLSYWDRQGVNSYSFFSLNGSNDIQSEYSLKMFKKFGRVYGGYMVGGYASRYLVINDPQLIKEVYVKNFNIFPDHVYFNMGPLPSANKMLFFMRGNDDWKRVRSIISPVFTSGKLKAMMAHISGISDEFIKNLETFERRGEVVDMRHYFGAFAMDVLIACAFGLRINTIKDPKHPVVVNSTKLLSFDISFEMFMSTVFPRLAHFLNLSFLDPKATDFLIKFSHEIINKRKEQSELGNNGKDFIQLMINSLESDDSVKNIDKLFSDEMIGQSLMFLIAGFDTTNSSLTHVVYHLSQNKDCQQLLYEELKDVTEFSYEKLSQLKYLNSCINESLRLSPPVIRLFRTSVEDFDLKGIKIPSGTSIEVCPYALHRDPDLWPEPLEFKPDRFFEPTHDPMAYLPFGAGQRYCLGTRFALNTIRMCCAKLFSKYEFSLSPDFKLEYCKGLIVLAPKNMTVTLKAR